MSSDLWSFSLHTYAQPGVEAACLTLQAQGLNVCLLLCGLWLAERGVACSEQRLQQLREVVEPWDMEVVAPLRALRTQWKTTARADAELNALREQIKALELEAERQLLLRLERLARDWPQDQVTDVSAWLAGVAANAQHLARDALHERRVAATGT